MRKTGQNIFGYIFQGVRDTGSLFSEKNIYKLKKTSDFLKKYSFVNNTSD